MDLLLSLLAYLGITLKQPVIRPIPETITIEIAPIYTKPDSGFSDIKRLPTPLPITPSTLGISTVSADLQTIHSTASGNVLASIPSPTPTVYKDIRNMKKTIALLGDSMIDTLGPSFPQLTVKLKETYPNAQLIVKNHGVGGKNINDGLTRLVKPYIYNETNFPSVISEKPDLIIVESFGYNPYGFEEGALDTHWLALAYIIDTIKQELPQTKIMLFATIAPDAETFGDGVPALSLDYTQKMYKTHTIKKYLENIIKFAKSENLPLADAYHKSLDNTGDGLAVYHSTTDHIHYSEKGKELVATILAEKIINEKLLE